MSLIGAEVSSYRILARIGAGGMGAVYLARHPIIGKQAAVKVLKPELAADHEQLIRFVNEARAASAIRHPGIVDVTDFGRVNGDGAPFLMMEYLEGESLAARLGRAEISRAEAVEIARQTAAAVHAAHERGIVHRDLKPDNLFLVRDEAMPHGLRIKVLDFGIAKLSEDVAGSLVKTHSGVVFGTPAYMSPEQCQRSGNVDRRSDVYALGVILYEMLCGRPPFDGKGATDVMMMHVGKAPTPPRHLNRNIPPALEQVVLGALEKKSDRRPQSMAALGAALNAAMDGTPPPAPRRSRRMVLAVAAATAGGVALGVFIWRSGRATPVTPVTPAPPRPVAAPEVRPLPAAAAPPDAAPRAVRGNVRPSKRPVPRRPPSQPARAATPPPTPPAPAPVPENRSEAQPRGGRW